MSAANWFDGNLREIPGFDPPRYATLNFLDTSLYIKL